MRPLLRRLRNSPIMKKIYEGKTRKRNGWKGKDRLWIAAQPSYSIPCKWLRICINIKKRKWREFSVRFSHAISQPSARLQRDPPADALQKQRSQPYCYKIFSGDRKPSRNALLRIAYGLPMTLDEAQFSLRLFGLARLDPRNLRDASLIFAFDRHFKLAQVQELLQELEEEPYRCPCALLRRFTAEPEAPPPMRAPSSPAA